MKKSLIALAVASAVSAPAFAATSNVDVYGILNVSVNLVDDNDYLNGSSNVSVVSNASRIGFKGTEDLGGGLAAIWQIESGFNVDETSGTIGSRNTYVGLKSDSMGTLLMGKHDTPMKMLGRKLDNFGDTMADSRNLLGATNNYGGTMFDLRTPNTIAYVSPSFSGLTVTAAYVTDWLSSSNSTTMSNIDNNERKAYSLSTVYENGPLMVGAAYEKQNDYSFSQNMWRLAAGYVIGDFKLGATYENSKSDDAENQRNAWGLFGNYSMGAITLKANYLKVGDNDSYGSSGAKQYALGADYALSKRTTVYGLYAKVKNDVNAGFGLGTGAGVSDRVDTNVNANWGDDFSVFSIGVKHSF